MSKSNDIISQMGKIIECVPNFSEGRNQEVINTIFNAAKRIKNVKVFGLEYNPDHNRMLFTITGAPTDVLDSVFESIKEASELIDMTKHKGEHPRIGATDVVPFVPISDVSMKECIELSENLAKKVADELKIPVYLYEESAKKPEYKNLADIRVGEFEGLKDDFKPADFGPSFVHPTAGAMVTGARKYLIAFNVNLDTGDVQIAKDIASKIREKGGGLPGVKALGFDVDGLAQVSMNLVDFEKTNFDKAYREVEKEAAARGVGIKNSEIYGMIPIEALVLSVRNTFKADTFIPDQILEKQIYE